MKIKYSKYIKYIIPVIFLVFIFLCSCIEALAEWYMRICYPVIAVVLSFVNRLFPFSLLDVLIIVAIVMLLYSIVMMCLKRLTFRKWSKIFGLSVLWLIIWFYMAWGIGYFRSDFYSRLNIEAPKEDKDYFENLVIRYIDSLNKAYISDPVFNAKEIDLEIEKLYEKHYQKLRLPYPCGWRRTKKTIIEPLMTRMGIAGFFNPFFNEVHVNNYLLPISYPYTLAHEKAHQLGIASEAECNLYATIICTSSSNQLIRYSGYLKTVWYLLDNLEKISPERYEEIIKQIDPRVIGDYKKIHIHWLKGMNKTLSDMQKKVYDSYLKTNKQKSGILSYSEMTGLLVAWELKNN